MYREKDYTRLRDSLAIDLLKLDQQLAAMPMRFLEAAEITAECSANRDACDFTLKRTESLAASKLRAAGAKQPSEAQIKSEILLDKAVADATNVLNDAELDANLWKALVDALRAKSSSLKHISELVVSGYLTPNASYDRNREDIGRQRAAREAGKGR